jgi:hypothetical protein
VEIRGSNPCGPTSPASIFEFKVEVPTIRHGLKQTLETLINEEAFLLAKYLRDETKTWTPRIIV